MIKQRVKEILAELPSHVQLIAATKGRNPSEILDAVEAGVSIIGENYVQEAEQKFAVIGNKVKWHLIGHLQKNKVKKAVRIFDLIETLDSLELAQLIDKECSHLGKVMPVFIEVNIAAESQKNGVMPEELEGFVKKVRKFKNIKLDGLMTMGPFLEDAELLRPYFSRARELFVQNKELVGWKSLSMGMSSSYKVAIEEGANIVRLGTIIFGERQGGVVL
jgi:pyridoxal phosphate enzyme (YggS family)